MTCLTNVLLFSVLCLITFTSAAPFLKTLLTTTTTIATHISDFRNLPRSDSRANRPDVFPGFDFLEEPTTARPRTPLDFYTRVIGGIASQGRQTYERIVNNIQKYGIYRRLDNLKRNQDRKLEYIPVESEKNENNVVGVSSTTESDSYDNDDEQLKPASKEQNWPKKYFSSILTSIGSHKLRNSSDPEYLGKFIGASATYINPLVDVWKRATMKLNLERDNNKNENDTTTTTATTPFHTSADIETPISNPSPSPPPSPTTTTLGFRYAFSKYLNLIARGFDGNNNNENKTISDAYTTELLSVDGGDVPWSDVNLNDKNDTTMDVDDGVDVPIGKVDELNDNEDDDEEEGLNANSNNNDDDDDDDESNDQGNFDPSNFGIFILEIFGTLAGLTWGAFAQLQSMFTQNAK